MPRFPVTPIKQQELEDRMAACGIRESDLEEQFIAARGPDGQKVNHTATGVRIRHVPSGLEVKWDRERSQGLNRFFARRRLCELLESMRQGREAPAARRAEKIRRQKNRRARRSKSRQAGADRENAGRIATGIDGEASAVMDPKEIER